MLRKLVLLVWMHLACLSLYADNDTATFHPLPITYASMGTPLFESYDLLYQFHDLDAMPELLAAYKQEVQKRYDLGIGLKHEKHLTKEERMSYLRSLRSLEKEKKRVMYQLTLLTMKAIDDENVALFNRVLVLPPDELFPTLSAKNKATHFYMTHPTIRTKAMDALSKEMIQLRKKRSLSNNGITYDEQKKRDYKLMDHLPQKPAKIDDNESQACVTGPVKDSNGFLSEVGKRCRALGINFDPSLIRKYQTYQPPTTKDLR